MSPKVLSYGTQLVSLGTIHTISSFTPLLYDPFLPVTFPPYCNFRLLLLLPRPFTTVFHQADGMGNPIMDLGHVVTALNKLDACNDEQVVLVSRDGKTMVIVTYGDVARALESAYGELCSKAVPPRQQLHY